MRKLIFAFLLVSAVAYAQDGFTGQTPGRGKLQFFAGASAASAATAAPEYGVNLGVNDNVGVIVFASSQGFAQENWKNQSYGAGLTVELFRLKGFDIGNEATANHLILQRKQAGLLVNDKLVASQQAGKYFRPYFGVNYSTSAGRLLRPTKNGLFGIELTPVKRFAADLEAQASRTSRSVAVTLKYTLF